MTRPFGTDAQELAEARARLYAPGSTAEDRARYESLLARHGGERTTAAAAPDDEDGSNASGQPPTPAGRRRPGWSLIAVAVALVVGVLAGFVVSGAVARSGTPRPAARTQSAPVTAVTAPAPPTPIAAASLGDSAAAGDASAAALRKALAIRDYESRVLALISVESEADRRSNAAWSNANRCSQFSGVWNVSIDGRPSSIRTVEGETSGRPTGTRFRLTIHLARAAAWSWVASGTRTGSDVHIVSVGAGAAASGAAQYAEFTSRATTAITDLRIVSPDRTPFLWQLEACTPG